MIGLQRHRSKVLYAQASSRAPTGGGFQDIIAQMQAAQEKANLVNEQRYQKILGTFENLGKAGRARIEQQTTQRQAAATQSLTSRGLGGTTITSAVERGIAGEAETQVQQLEEGIAVQKAGVMERRTDAGPDLGMFASLLQMAGQQQPQQRQVISGGLGPMARRGLDVFGQPMGRFGGGGAGQATTQTQRPATTSRTGVGTGIDVWKRKRAAEALQREMFTGGTTFIRGGTVR